MSDVIFARPRTDYDSYTDMYSLIRLSGYPLVFFDEIDPASDNCYILTMVNGENQYGWESAQTRIILWDLEWRLDGEYPRVPGVSEIWASDAWYAEQIGARYVPFGSHDGLNPCPADLHMPQYDVIMLAYMTNRRQQLAAWLGDKQLTIAPNGWSEDRHRAMLSARVMLHCHQHDGIRTVAPQRFALAAAYKMPLISETLTESAVFGHTHALYADYEYLPDIVKIWKDDQRLVDYGLALHDLLCEQLTFSKCVEAAL